MCRFATIAHAGTSAYIAHECSVETLNFSLGVSDLLSAGRSYENLTLYSCCYGQCYYILCIGSVDISFSQDWESLEC